MPVIAKGVFGERSRDLKKLIGEILQTAMRLKMQADLVHCVFVQWVGEWLEGLPPECGVTWGVFAGAGGWSESPSRRS